MKKKYLFVCLCFLVFNVNAQYIVDFEGQLNIPVTINGNQLKNPWVGGFNTPIFSTIDLNGDGLKDLFVFDKDGGRYTTYIRDKIQGQVSYTYAPKYAERFPLLHDWVLLYDFDCDGKEDIFTYTYIGGMEVWHNDYSLLGGLKFSLFSPLIYSKYGLNNVNLYVSAVNLPALADIDNDGDMDVLTFAITGNNVEFHMNKSMDSTGVCGLDYVLEDDCWGHFLLSGLSNIAVLGACKPALAGNPDYLRENPAGPVAPFANRHSGSCMIAVDYDGNNVKELINGDILGNNLLYLNNTGSTDSAYVTSQDSLWPSYDVPVNFITFPAAYNFDIDNDGKKDMAVTSCTANTSENFNNILFYKNTGTVNNATFSYQKNTLFQDEMIEVGSGANVALFDADADGKKDLIIGNYGYFSPTPPYISGLSFYKNTGTLSSPAFELITRDYMQTSSLGITGIYPAFGDIDADGDADMILGCTDGTLQLYLNTAGPGNVPNFSMPIAGPNFLGIDVGLFSAPQLVDIDRDGRIDLLIGERQGNLNYYQNTGSASVLNFTLVSTTFGNVDVVKHNVSITGYSVPFMIDVNGSYELFVGSESGYIYRYNNIDNNLNGAFALLDTAYKNINERPRITIALGDINNDGLTDIFTGNNEGGVKFYYQKLKKIPVKPKKIPALFFDPGVRSSELVDSEVDIFPNPATDQLLVKFDKFDFNKIEIYDLHGNLVFRSEETAIQKRIDISNFSAGLYILKVTNQQKTINKKFVISR